MDDLWAWIWIGLGFFAGLFIFFFNFEPTGSFLRKEFGEKADDWALYAWLMFMATYSIREFFSRRRAAEKAASEGPASH